MKQICNLSTFTFLTIYLMIIYGTSCKTEDPNKPKLLPVLSTSAITKITQNTATSGGNITSDNGLEVSARGVCWSLKPNPTINDSVTKDAAGTGEFVSNLSNLIADTTYYVRAYATNIDGTAYGLQATFKTLASVLPVLTTTVISDITVSTATSGGNITFDGGSAVTARGVCWSTNPYPTILNDKTSDGDGTGSFKSNITNLITGTTYYFRSYATNKVGTGYGIQTTFKTLSIPSLTTTTATSTTATTSNSGGNITSDGGATVSERGVCWSTNTNPTTTDNKTSNGTGIGVFTSSITGLTAGSTYYVRSFATNSIGTAYGNQISLTTQNGIIILTTTPASSITTTSSISGGNITSIGGVAVIAKGVCWSTSPSPTLDNSKTSDGIGIGVGVFSSSITGLTKFTTYYVRSYATNSIGTAYGNQVIFTTNGTVSDIDGNIYQTIILGTQTWMVENLKTTKYRDGSIIANVTDNTAWAALSSGAWCDNSNLAANGSKYGHLYNWYATRDSRNIAPVGWHVPTDADWTTLTSYLGGESVAGGKLKEADTLNWASPNIVATTTTGFSALPGGYRYNNGTFNKVGEYGFWWSSSENSAKDAAWYRIMYYINSEVFRNYNNKLYAYSVRCIRD